MNNTLLINQSEPHMYNDTVMNIASVDPSPETTQFGYKTSMLFRG